MDSCGQIPTEKQDELGLKKNSIKTQSYTNKPAPENFVTCIPRLTFVFERRCPV